jgi:uncharacterized secreted protein with C-terminal beta-propeller domain
MKNLTKTAIVATAFALVMTACATTGIGVGTPAFAASLVRFDACEDFLAHVKAEAKEIVTAWGLDGGGYWIGGRFDDMAGPEALEFVATTVAASADAAQAIQEYSGTNVQVEGVDEPDIVKTDGERIFAIANGKLYLIDVTGEKPVVTGSLSLDYGWGEMFISGDKVLISSNSGGYYPVDTFRGIAPDEYYGGYTQVTTLTEIDVSDPADLKVANTLHLDGRYVSARMMDDSIRIVISAQPVGFEWQYPTGGGLFEEIRARNANRRIIDESTLENWIPYFIAVDADGNTADGLLLQCENAYRPQEFSGLGMLTVVTVDLNEGINPDNAVGVLAQGDQVYASTTSLYVTSSEWVDTRDLTDAEVEQLTSQQKTAIHKFDVSDPLRTEYRASGEVTGYMLNQFAMDEHEGYLRVATTDEAPWWGGGGESQSFMSVLQEIDGELRLVGQVGGLGKTERIYSVRFIGDTAYVVTFRQTDPLYTIDLSDPTNPTVAGELKILGYSAYLHPLEDGLLLGVGQDADDQGRVKGTQVSVFDVSDITNPTRLDQYTLSDSNSAVEFDHRAFLYWPATSTVVIPINKWGWNERLGTEDYFAGALALEIDRAGVIREAGVVTHNDGDKPWDWRPGIERSIVIGDVLYTYSQSGLQGNDMSTFDPMSWVDFT